MFKTLKTAKSTFPAGGRKVARFAALVDSDSESECDSDSDCEEDPSEIKLTVEGTTYIIRGDDVFTESGEFFGKLSEVTAHPTRSISTVHQAALRGDVLWGDISDNGDPLPISTSYSIFPAYANIWDEAFADKLDHHVSDLYDTSALSDDEWAACMTWLFAKGWHLWRWNRDSFEAIPDNLPPRVWTPADIEGEYVPEPELPDPVLLAMLEALEKNTVDTDPVPVPVIKKKKLPAYIPRFCREGTACTREGCSFEHSNRILKQNKVCGFGATCSKRSQCIYVHPDETWSDSLFIFRE